MGKYNPYTKWKRKMKRNEIETRMKKLFQEALDDIVGDNEPNHTKLVNYLLGLRREERDEILTLFSGSDKEGNRWVMAFPITEEQWEATNNLEFCPILKSQLASTVKDVAIALIGRRVSINNEITKSEIQYLSAFAYPKNEQAYAVTTSYDNCKITFDVTDHDQFHLHPIKFFNDHIKIRINSDMRARNCVEEDKIMVKAFQDVYASNVIETAKRGISVDEEFVIKAWGRLTPVQREIHGCVASCEHQGRYINMLLPPLMNSFNNHEHVTRVYNKAFNGGDRKAVFNNHKPFGVREMLNVIVTYLASPSNGGLPAQLLELSLLYLNPNNHYPFSATFLNDTHEWKVDWKAPLSYNIHSQPLRKDYSEPNQFIEELTRTFEDIMGTKTPEWGPFMNKLRRMPLIYLEALPDTLSHTLSDKSVAQLPLPKNTNQLEAILLFDTPPFAVMKESSPRITVLKTYIAQIRRLQTYLNPQDIMYILSMFTADGKAPIEIMLDVDGYDKGTLVINSFTECFVKEDQSPKETPKALTKEEPEVGKNEMQPINEIKELFHKAVSETTSHDFYLGDITQKLVTLSSSELEALPVLLTYQDGKSKFTLLLPNSPVQAKMLARLTQAKYYVVQPIKDSDLELDDLVKTILVNVIASGAVPNRDTLNMVSAFLVDDENRLKPFRFSDIRGDNTYIIDVDEAVQFELSPDTFMKKCVTILPEEVEPTPMERVHEYLSEALESDKLSELDLMLLNMYVNELSNEQLATLEPFVTVPYFKDTITLILPQTRAQASMWGDLLDDMPLQINNKLEARGLILKTCFEGFSLKLPYSMKFLRLMDLMINTDQNYPVTFDCKEGDVTHTLSLLDENTYKLPKTKYIELYHSEVPVANTEKTKEESEPYNREEVNDIFETVQKEMSDGIKEGLKPEPSEMITMGTSDNGLYAIQVSKEFNTREEAVAYMTKLLAI